MSTPRFTYTSADEDPADFADRPRISVSAEDAPVATEIEANYRAHDFGNGWGSRWEATTTLLDGQPTATFVLNHHVEKKNSNGVHTQAFEIQIEQLSGLIEMLSGLQNALNSLDIDTGGKTT